MQTTEQTGWMISRCLFTCVGLTVALAASPLSTAYAADEEVSASLTREKIDDGWIRLFDGQTTFGWKIDGGAKLDNGKIKVSGSAATLTSTTAFSEFELSIAIRGTRGQDAELELNKYTYPIKLRPRAAVLEWKVEAKPDGHIVRVDKLLGESSHRPKPTHTPVTLRFPPGVEAEISAINLRPMALKSIFNGKDLTGWKALGGQECEKCKSVFSVTEKGEINVKNGPGDLQSDDQWQNFVAQLDVLSNGEHLNSGIFFRSLKGQFWQGYEAQIRNQWEGDDRTKPVDFGTGGIYNRQPSRKVGSSDHEWFTYTIVADGPHIALWVNGYQTADYVDDQKPADSARRGQFLGKGCITIQGHDPTTDLSFRKIRVAELQKEAAAAK